jgi:hypothetical protein
LDLCRYAGSLATFSDHSSLNALKRSTTEQKFQRTKSQKRHMTGIAPISKIPGQRDKDAASEDLEMHEGTNELPRCEGS